MATRNRYLLGIVLLVLAFSLGGPSLSAACETWLGKPVSLQGSVQVRRSGETQWVPVRPEEPFCPGDTVRVGERSRAAVRLRNDSVLRLDQKTNLTFSGVEDRSRVLLDLLEGAAHFFSHRVRSLKVTTPFLNAVVEGTEFYVRVESGETHLSVFDGRVAATGTGGSLSLGKGQSAVARAGEVPALQVVVRPRDAVQWTLYYPPLLEFRPREVAGAPGSWQAAVGRSLEALRARDTDAAFAALRDVPEEISDADFFLYRAALLLSVGRIDQANADLGKALELDPRSSRAHALQSTIAVARNEKERALELARRAVELDAASATARVALSYALQARFDLNGAVEAAEAAVRLDDQNALAWARLAELQQSVGNLGKASEAAARAVALEPELARTRTVLGFSELLRIRTHQAKAAFAKAIELDQADPLPRLGLGLAKIRDGDLSAGREELEVAAALDTGNSLVRSYLGKAYFEGKRDAPAARELAIAKELDPLDPTPWFYDAIRKQTINRPVEALHDLQRSIELSNNRAVYRSRLLLDDDLAARGASLANVYADMGFEQLALAEGFKSVNADPANHSAHRFVAESYAALPRHEIARVNELLQSQLLQPIQIAPVQPHLEQTSLFILEGAGPSSPAMNEFTPLFLRNRLAFQAAGVAGGNQTWGDELLLSGVSGPFSFSAGQFHYETEGFRANHDQTVDLYQAFVQATLSPAWSLQAEYRHLESERGDLFLRFNGDFSPDERNEDTADTYRLGIRFKPSGSSVFLGSLIYQDTDKRVSVPESFEIDVPNGRYHLAELRYLLSARPWNVTAGVGYLKKKELWNATFATELGPISMEVEESPRLLTSYLYSTYSAPSALLTGGVSADRFDGLLGEWTQYNPKLGLLWTPFPATTFRAAAVRTLKRPISTELDVVPTLEPTEVAGFNQFFSDPEATSAWRYGVGLDQRLPSNVWTGFELSGRRTREPFFFGSGGAGEVLHVQGKERQLRGYAYWAASKRLTSSVEYLYEHFENDSPDLLAGVEQFTDLVTQRVPLGLRYHHPAGVQAAVTATYVHQKGDFTVPVSPIAFGPAPGRDSFWIFDASVAYRFPRRLGSVAVEAKNLFAEKFQFQDTDPGNPQIMPDRLLLVRLSLSL
jgi:tetratricopeptide (TPR) repeat protein